jgi:hypothetical protein
MFFCSSSSFESIEAIKFFEIIGDLENIDNPD